MLCPQFRPLLGGYEQAAERLSHELAARGHEVEVVTERRQRDWPRFECFGAVRVRRLWCARRRGMHSLTSITTLALFLLRRGRRYDVFHVHQYGWYSTIAILLGRLLRVPVVLKLTSTGPQGIRVALGLLPAPPIHMRLHRHLSACIATSRRGAKEIEALGLAPSRIHLITNGLDTERFRPASPDERSDARRALGLDDRVLAITVSRISAEKDPGTLLEAWSRLDPQANGLHLAMLGDGPELAAVESEIEERGLGASVSTPGSKSNPLPWYHAADLFLLTSKNEGLSNALMEASSCGLPVISTHVSGSEDMLGDVDAGRLVEIGNATELARALAELSRDPALRDSCGAQARRYAEGHYAMPAVGDAVERLYRDLTET